MWTLMAAFFAAYSALWWSDVDWQVLLAVMGVVFALQVAVAVYLKASERIDVPESLPRRDASAMSLPERTRYVWERFTEPSRKGQGYRATVCAPLGAVWVGKAIGASVDEVILFLAVSVAVGLGLVSAAAQD
jgi:hypothetical protein